MQWYFLIGRVWSLYGMNGLIMMYNNFFIYLYQVQGQRLGGEVVPFQNFPQICIAGYSDKAEHSYHLAGPMQGWKAWSHVFSYFQCHCIHCIPWLLPLGVELHHLCFHVTIHPCLSSWFLYSLSFSLSLSRSSWNLRAESLIDSLQ